MVQGTLQVLLVSAKKLKNSEFFDAGTEPEWNESFVFTVTDDTKEIFIKLMDKDNFNADDFLGEARIPLAPVFQEGNHPPTVYRVVKGQEFCGEVKVALTFTPSKSCGMPQEEFGGWKQSALH